ncbi:MAG: phosphatase PAP2 family protein [Candidatus Thermoplasmatota archaeon]|nr:phosphatase PAP2 family protein [Candidatus Thermoplasmatota archaeon]
MSTWETRLLSPWPMWNRILPTDKGVNSSLVRISILTIVTMLPLYGLTNWMQVWIGRSVMNPQIGLDRDIPAIPESVWIYLGLFWFAYPVLLILVPKTVGGVKSLITGLQTLFVVELISIAIFFIAPAEVDLRDQMVAALVDLDTMTSQVVETMIGVDQPMSSWPSLHVSHCVIIWAMGRHWMIHQKHPDFVRILYGTTLLLIIFSTLTTKQHHIFDLVTGGALGFYASVLMLRQDTFTSLDSESDITSEE